MRFSCSVIAGLVLAVAVAEAREYSPRVVSPHNADAYSMKTFAQFPRWRGLRDDALAWEVYQYLADTRTGLFHMNRVLEGREVLGEYREVRDPVKIINVYGYAYCAILGPVMAGVAEDMGLGPARTLTLPGWGHVAAEAFYGGKWHYLDLDVRAVFRRADGTLASMDEARRDPSLWRGRGPLFFPNDPLDSTRRVYEKTPVERYHGFHQGGHTMDYVLRQGETFTRWWAPQGGRWNHVREYHEEAWLRKLLEQEPRGPKPNHRHFTMHNHANGRFDYRPDLTDRSTDTADGLYDAVNVRPGPQGLSLAAPGEGHAVFEFRTPYVIVPLVGDMSTTDDDCEASVATLDAAGASLSISLDNGLTWQDLPSAPLLQSGAGPGGKAAGTRLDMTRYVSGAYGYLLKITLRGGPGKAVLRSLAVTTWVQVAPAALPSLRRGANRMEYRTGDHYGLETRAMEVRCQAGDPRDLLKYLAEPPNDYDPARKTERIRGPAVVRIEAPPRSRIAWFTAEGSFRTYQREAARNTRNTIAYAADGAAEFREIYRADVPADTDHWHCNAHREVKLERPAAGLRVRYVGDPALNNFRIVAHCLEEGRPSARPARITHAWLESGRAKRQTVAMARPGAYEITIENEPADQWIEIAVPSDKGK